MPGLMHFKIFRPPDGMEVYRYEPLISGVLLGRLNRFVCEVLIDGDKEVTLCYMANPGSMLGMCIAGAPIRASRAPPGSSKFQYRVEGIKIGAVWIGCNTMLANKIIASLLSDGSLLKMGVLSKYDSFRQEVQDGATRFDFVTFSSEAGSSTMIEVKTVTMASNWFDVELTNKRACKPFHRFPTSRPAECHETDGSLIALFPDCESTRAQKHVMHLATCAKRHKTSSMMVFVVVRDDVSAVMPSEYCDPTYAELVSRFGDKEISCVALQFRMNLEDAMNASVEFIKDIPVVVAPLSSSSLRPNTNERKPKRAKNR